MQVDSSASGVVVIDLDALARNYALVRKTVAPAECGAVVKADAYGLGIGPVARRLSREGCGTFFIATLAEGLELRRILPRARIFVLEGALEGADRALVDAELVPVLNSLEQVRRWYATRRPAALHLDTGMTRLGLSEREVVALAADRGTLRELEIAYVMTHLACADEPEHALNVTQLAVFERMRRMLPDAPTSIGSSAVAFSNGARCGDLARIGIALYGGNPFVARANPMKAVVTLRAPVLQVRELDDSVTIGYGATYAAAPPTRIAVVGLGYADGYMRTLGNRGFGCIGGVRVPVVGRVSMDLVCLDVTKLPPEGVRVGTLVHFIGGGITLDEVAEAAGTISYEILSRLGPRLRRLYLGDFMKERP